MGSESEKLTGAVASETCHLLDESMVKIRHCLNQLNDQQCWWRPHETHNSIANLLLHLAGNLNQWVVEGVAEKPGRRDRDGEFAARENDTHQELVNRLDQTVNAAKTVIGAVAADGWLDRRVIQNFETTVLGAIMHSVPHFVGHTHQIIYITRTILGDQYRFEWQPKSDKTGVPV